MTMETVATNGTVPEQKKNRIQVSNTKKPLFFYVNLAKVGSPFFYTFLYYDRRFIFYFLSTTSDD